MKHYPFFSGEREEASFRCDILNGDGVSSLTILRENKTLEWKWFFRTLFVFILMTAFSFQGVAQTPVSREKAFELYGVSLSNLVTGLNPTVFITDGGVTVAGDGSPEVLICDGASVSALYTGNPSFKRVKLLRINIQSEGDLPDPLDLDALQGFENLQFIYFVFGYDVCGDNSDSCLGEKVGGLIPGHDGAVITLYEISIAQ